MMNAALMTSCFLEPASGEQITRWQPGVDQDPVPQCRGQVARQGIDRIEVLAKMRGAVPVPPNREPKRFEWAVRFQVDGERVSNMALEFGPKGAPARERNMRKSIDEVLSWVRLERRRDPGGRPPG